MSEPLSLSPDIPPDLLADGIVSTSEVTSGHIHLTWRAVDSNGLEWAVQRLSTSVFPDPDALDSNLGIVTDAVGRAGVPTLEVAGVGPGGRRMLRRGDEVWRASRWITGRHLGSTGLDGIKLAAAAFGRFDAALSDVVGVVEVLPRFHDPIGRFDRLAEVVSEDCVGRASRSEDLIDRLTHVRSTLSEQIESWSHLPVRVAHNDAKSTNVILTPDGNAVVIDLDTVMPGTVLSDIGELVRSSLQPAEDQESDGPISPAVVAEIIGGFVGEFGPLHNDERDLAPYAGPILTVENAVRFLTDHIEGDTYYSVSDPEHNFRRAQAQTALAERLVAISSDIADAVEANLGG